MQAISATINGSPQTIIDAMTYRGDNQLTNATFGNGATDSRSYDLQGRLTSQQLNGSALIDERSYNYDKNSNILNILGTAETNAYGYDPLDRITTDTINAGTAVEFSYDLNDNRLTKTDEHLTVAANSNRLLRKDAIINNGSLPRFMTRTLEYNDAGRLFRLIEEGNLKATYLYNDNGQRTNKTIHHPDTTTTTTLYHYDQFGQLVSETTPSGTPQRDYIWHDNGEAKAQIDINGGTDNISYLHSDHLLTTRLATDNSQQVIWQWQGEAFGETEANEIGGVSVNFRFPGQYFDGETNLHYNHFRYYDPEIGRYITSDPIGMLGGFNTYSYVGLNPMSFIDPSGTVKATVTLDLSGIVGPFGGSRSAGIAFDDEGNVCSIVTKCQTNGELTGKRGSAGLFAGGGIGASISSGEFCSGQSQSEKDALSGGFFGSLKGSVSRSENGDIKAGKGVVGFGFGASITTEQCTTVVRCL
jgi:RHS repeat-associated protein